MCWLTVEHENQWPDGYLTRDRFVNEWDGWSAADARRHRLKRFRDARVDVTKDGPTLVTTTDRDGWTEVQRLTFTDEHPDSSVPPDSG